MTRLENYLQDGANYQARAVLMLLQGKSNIEESWNDEFKQYDAEINVGRWENCREQGYVVSLRTKGMLSKQLNIAFFEHRNSDDICAVKWEQSSFNSLTIDNAEFDEVYKNKYDVSFSTKYCEVEKMTDWIEEQLKNFWIINSK